MPILQQYNNFYQHSSIFMFGSLSRKEDRMVCLSRRSDHFSKQMVSSPVWWCISGEHQHWGYSPFYRLPRHDHLSGGKMEKLNLSVSLRLTTQRGIFLQNHFLRPTLALQQTWLLFWLKSCMHHLTISQTCRKSSSAAASRARALWAKRGLCKQIRRARGSKREPERAGERAREN